MEWQPTGCTYMYVVAKQNIDHDKRHFMPFMPLIDLHQIQAHNQKHLAIAIHLSRCDDCSIRVYQSFVLFSTFS